MATGSVDGTTQSGEPDETRRRDFFVCVTCGTQFAATERPPEACPICEDDRQYIGPHGQQWTTLAELTKDHKNVFRELDTNLTAIVTEPKVAIGQQAHFIETPRGNVLWDCITYVDDATVAEIKGRGGLAAIAISHPHFFSCMIEWSRALGDVPIYLYADHRPWVMRPDDAVVYWQGETKELLPGVTVIRCGGHFPGSSVLHWAAGADGRGSLFTGDTIYVSGGEWVAAVLESSDRARYVESLELIRGLDFDVLVPSIASAGQPYHEFVDRDEAVRQVDAILARVRRGDNG